jgi:hypothetical protein
MQLAATMLVLPPLDHVSNQSVFRTNHNIENFWVSKKGRDR